MTRKEYAQSMLDQGKTKEETIELVKKWDIDNKPTEVEKPQATATNAAPVVASPTDSTESSSEYTSLELPEDIKPVEVKGIDYSKSEFNNLNFFNENIQDELLAPDIEQTSVETEIKVEDPKEEVVIQGKSTELENDIIFDLKEKKWNDQKQLDKIAKKNNLNSIIMLDNMTEEAKKQYLGGQDQNLMKEIELNGNVHVGYAEVSTISDKVLISDYENPDMISMLDPEVKAGVDRDEQTILQQEEFIKIKEANKELSNDISSLNKKLIDTEDPVEKKIITNSINELQIKIRNNNKNLNVQFAPPTLTTGTGSIRQYAPVFKNNDGKLYVSKDTSFKSNPLPELDYSTDTLGNVRITEEYEDNANRELAELQTERINQATNQGKDKVIIPRIDEIKTSDIRDPKQLLNSIFNFGEDGEQIDEEIMYDFLNASGVPSDLKQNASAKLFNEAFSLYGFYAIEGPGNTLRIYNKPKFKDLYDKNGDIIDNPNYLDISTQQTEVDEENSGEYFEVSINTNDTRSFKQGREPGFMGLMGVFSRGRKVTDSYSEIRDTELYKTPEMQKLLKDGRGLYSFMEKSLETNKDANGNYYIDEDNIRVSKTPSSALVKATELQADDSQNAILENKKVMATLEKNIMKEQKSISKEAKVLNNVSLEREKLSTNEKYNNSNEKLKEFNSSIEEKNNRIIEINSQIEKLNPGGNKKVDEATFKKIKPLIDEYKSIDLEIKNIQKEAKPLIDIVSNESKDYKKAYDKYEKAGGKEYQADLFARQIANQENFNINMSTLVAQSIFNEDLIEDAQRDLMTSTSTFLDWAENTKGRGDLLGYTVNRMGKGVRDISKGLGGFVFDLLGAADSLADDNPEEARKYWENAKKQIRANADENWRQKWKDHDTDDIYTRNFEESDTGQAYGVMLDMLVDFGFGFIGTGGAAAGLGFGLASGMRISEGIEQEIDQLEEESKYVRNENGEIAYDVDKNGDIVLKDGKPVKTKNPDYKPLSSNEKLAYKSAIVVASTILEKIGFQSFSGIGKTKLASYVLSRVLKNGKKLNPYTLKRLVQRETKDLVSRGFFKFTSGVGGEIATEISQDGVEMVMKNVANSWRDGKQFDFFDAQKLDKNTFERWWQTAKVTAYATAPLAGIGGGISMIQKNNLEKASAKNIAAFSAYAKTPELRKAFIKQQQLLLDQNKIEQSDYDSRVKTLNQVAGILESYEKVDLSSKANKTVLQLELEIASLKNNTNENKAASSLAQDGINERQKAIEEVIKKDQENGGGKAERLQNKINKSKLVENIENQSNKEVIIVTDKNRKDLVNQYELSKDQQKDFEKGGLYISKDDGPTVILIDEDAAENVFVHEDRHDFFAEVLADPKNENASFALAGLIEQRLNSLPDTPNNLRAKAKIQMLQNKYREDSNYDASMLAEEMIMFFGDALGDKSSNGLFKIDLNESGFQKIKNNIKRQYREAFNIDVKIKNDQDLVDLIRDHRRAVETGKVSKRLQRVREGKLDLDAKLLEDADDSRRIRQAQRKEEVNLIESETNQDTQVSDIKMAASKDLDIKDTLDVIVQNPDGTRKFDTKDDFKNDSVALYQAYDTIQNTNLLDGRIKQDIGKDKSLSEAISLAENPEEIKTDIVRKVKENLAVRAIKNFDPSKNESLFGYMLGKRPLTIEALKDVKKEYVKNVGSKGGNVRIDQTQEGGSLDFEDTGVDIEGQVDEGIKKAPRSTFRRNIKRDREKGLTPQEVKEFEEISQPLVDKLPDVNAKNYRTQVNKVAGPALKKWVNDNIFNNNWGEQFIIDNYNNIRDLGIDYLIDLDKGLQKQGNPRMFTKFNRKLTTQAEIRKYRDSGRAFVENEAQGVSLFDILDPGDQAMADFYLKDSPSNRSNRKGKLAEAFGKKMFKDVQPQIRNKRGDSDQVKATSARKTQVVPTLLFNKGFSQTEVNDLVLVAEASDINAAGAVSGIPRGSITINDSNRKQKQKTILQNIKDFKLSLNVFESSMPASAGAQYNRRSNGDVYYKTSNGNQIKGNPVLHKEGKYKGQQKYNKSNKKMFTQPSLEQIEAAEGKGVTLVAARNRLYYGKSDPAYKIALEAARENTKKGALKPKKVSVRERITKAFISKFKQRSKDNMKVLEDVAFELNDAVKDGMPASTAALIIAQGYQATGGLIKISAPFTDVSSDFDYGPEGSKQGDRSKRAFIEEHNPPASTIGGTLIWAISNNKTREIFPFIKKNYRQTQLSKASDYLLDMAKLDKRLPKGTSILDDSIIRLSEAGINTNKIIDPVSGRSRADIFGLGVADSVSEIPGVVSKQNSLIKEVVINGLDIKTAKQRLDVYVKFPNNGQPSLAKTQNNSAINNRVELKASKVLDIDKDLNMEELLSKAAGIDEALRLANSLNQPVKKIRVFDFDDTLAKSNNKVFATKGNERVEMNAEKFASDAAQMIEDGWTMDFSDFNNVTEGKKGPLFDVAKTIKDSRGNEDLFVLTARGPDSQQAIYDFLKAEGLEFKKENIVGLGKSPGEAKANWMIDKAAEGYNDFYFADDAYQNVKAVRDVMSVIDVKSKVQQAKIKQSKNLSEEFNSLLQETTGVDTFKEYSAAKAKTIGASKGNFKFFIPYSAEDFLGLVYPTLSKGSKGDAQMAWYKTNLIDKYTKAQENLSTARLNLMNDFKQLKKSLNVPSNLRKKNDNGFTNEQAVRVHLFTSMGYEVPGLSKRDLKQLNDTVENDATLKEFSEQILQITKGDGYANPDANWLVGNITTDLISLINTEKRSKYLANWQESVDAIYSKENLNKLEALYGTKYVDALTNMLTRMKTGKNRLTSGSKIENQILDYVNGSIGTIMFFNTRSAVLQTISSINFVNWSFNNPYQAGKAFANQKQYWSDFKELMNSDYLLDRRNGLKLNISESEIADAAATSKNKAKAAINYILSKGFLPTQYADSFAIASGGATFYRNRIKDLVRQGKTETEAKKQALIEFRQVAEESQQSSDPSRISQQQSSNVGRLILAFANTPMQYARIQKRAIQDLVNGRGDAKSHVSRIVYYGFVQNVIFNALQQAVFALGFGDDDDEKEEAKNKKYLNVANGMLDSLLRGLGIGGAAVSVAKNFLMDIYERSGRDRPEYVDSVWEVTRFSPPIYSKLSKLKQAGWQFDSKKRRELIFEKGFSLDNPAYEAAAKVVSATTNVPLDRVMYKIKNIEGALDEDNEIWQRVAMMGGWPKWQLESPKTAADLTPEQKAEVKAKSKVDNYKKAKGSKDYDTIKRLTSDQQIKMLKSLGFGEYTIKNAKTEKAKIDLIIAKNSKKKNIVDKKAIEEYKYKKLNKAEQVRKLDSLGLSKEEIKALKLESDRVEKLLELMK